MILKATSKGWTVLVRLLLAIGADVNTTGEDNETLLIIASKKGHTKIAKLLLKKGANVKARDSYDGYTPLIWASQYGRISIVSLLLEKGADVNERNKYGSGALMEASWFGHTKVVELLLKNGADVDAVGDFGRTPLITACIYGYSEIVELLLNYGADLNVTNNDRETALVSAAQNGHTAMVKLLLSYGPNNRSIYNALNWALFEGHHEIIELLRPDGTEAINNALMWAERAGYHRIVELLHSNGTVENEIDKEIVTASMGNLSKDWFIPEITKEHLTIDLIDSKLLKEAGPGEESFYQAIQNLNDNKFLEAISNFENALELGLDPLRQGYAYAELGNIMIKNNKLIKAIEHFVKVLTYKQALYESIHHASQYLVIVLTEIGRIEEASLLRQLAIQTQSHLGYSLSPAIAENVRSLVRNALKSV